MKRLIIAGAVTAATALSGIAQINSADAGGYLSRGVAMYRNGNYNGCIDQLLHMRQLNASEDQKADAFYYIAMSTLYCGDDEALDLLRNYLTQYPASPHTQEVEAAIGDYYFTRGNYMSALEIYDRINPDGLTSDIADDMTYRMAYSNLMIGNNDRAITLFDSLTGNSTYGNAATFYKGYIAYSLQDYTAARRYFEQTDPNREPGQATEYYLSQIYFIQGDYERALASARRALERGAVPEFDSELTRLCGESLYNLDRHDEAIPYLKKYIALSGDDARPSAYYMLGVSEYDVARYSEAIDMLRHATAPSDAMGQSAYLYLGQCYVKQHNTSGALMAFERAYRMDYDSKITEAALYNYIAARMDGGRLPFGSSVDMLEDFLKKYPSSPYATSVNESLVTGYMSSDDYNNALRILRGITNPSAKMQEAHGRALFMAGTRAYNNGISTALPLFSEAATLKGASAEVKRQSRLWEGLCLYDTNRYEESAESILAFLRLAPASDSNRPVAYYTLGYCRMAQERYDDALDDFNRVETTDATMKADALNRAGDCLYLQREYTKAAQQYQKAYHANPQTGDYALYQLAAMKGLTHDYKGCIASLDDMMSRFPSSALVPDALLDKADAYTALGKTTNAAEIYEELAERYPATAQGRKAGLQLAMAAVNAGNTESAIEAYQNVVRAYPSSDEARVALDDLKKIYADSGQLTDYVMFVNSVPGVPDLDSSELDSTAFTAAENAYLTDYSISLIQKYTEQFPQGANMPAALYYLADANSRAGEAETAIRYATRVTEEYPDADVAEEALLIKASNEAVAGKGEMALDSYRRLEARSSSPRTLHEARMGIMLTAIELNRYTDALEASEQLLATSAAGANETRQIQFCRALALDRTGRHDEAATLWEALASDPSDLYGSKSAVYLAESLLEHGHTDKARKVADAFTDAGSPFDYWYARGFIVLSDILRAQGHEFEADEYLKNIISNYPGDEPDIIQMAEIRLSRNK